MSESAEPLLTQLADQGVLSQDDVADLRATLGSDALTRDGSELAEELVALNKLTPYQADTVAAGDLSNLILGNYIILDRLGEGGMGHVYKARHRDMDRIVALKVLPPEWVNSQARLRRFRQEIKAAARLSHPNIVTAFDADVTGGIPYLVMEYIPGKDLQELLAQVGPLPVATAVDYIMQTARGLAYAHRVGVVHRDIKPGNLLLDEHGVIHILDMGVAQVQDISESSGEEETKAHSFLTREGAMVGTADFMSPEQAKNARIADARSDVYSLGCTLYFLLTNAPIFRGDSVVDRIFAHRDQPVPSLRDARPDVSPQLDEIFRRMVAKNPNDRYQTIPQLLGDLETSVRAQQPQHAPAPGDDHRRPRRTSRWGSLITLGMLALVALLGYWAYDKYYPGQATLELTFQQPPVEVLIMDKSNSKYLPSVTAESNRWQSELPSGRYQVSISKEGFLSKTLDVRLAPRKSLTLDINLEPAATDENKSNYLNDLRLDGEE